MAGAKEWRLMLKAAEGGVLFLDEAYQVGVGGEDGGWGGGDGGVLFPATVE